MNSTLQSEDIDRQKDKMWPYNTVHRSLTLDPKYN